MHTHVSSHCAQFESAATAAADEITAPRPAGEEVVQPMQVLLASDAASVAIRGLHVR